MQRIRDSGVDEPRGPTDDSPVVPAPVAPAAVVMPSAAGLPIAAALTIAAAVAFAVLATWIARRGATLPVVDDRIHVWVIAHRSHGSITFARVVTLGGATGVVLPALIVVGALASRGGRDLLRRLLTGLLIAGVASVGVFMGLQINALVGRARPSMADWAWPAGGASFPSGHTTTATLFATGCAWVVAARVRPGWPRRTVWATAVGWAAAVGWSRVWLGVHWPTDVLGGWLYGLAWFAGCAWVLLALRRRSARRLASARPDQEEDEPGEDGDPQQATEGVDPAQRLVPRPQGE